MSRRNHENDTHVDSSSGRAQNTRGAQRTHDAMVRKVRAGHVTSGRVYGYDNIEILSGLLDAYGRPKRDHVEQRVNQEQAAVVRRIFMLCAAAKGWCPSLGS